MPDLHLPISSRVQARRAARRRARIRGAVVLGGGMALLLTGVTTAAVVIAGGDRTDASVAAAITDVPDVSDAVIPPVQISASPSGEDPDAGTSEADGAEPAEVEPVATVALSATAGSVAGGETVTLTGTDLAGVAAVDFGDVTATITATSDDAVTVVVPASTDYAAGDVDVTVETDTGTVVADSSLSYTYEEQTGVDKQLAYALAHWNDYNIAEYGDDNPIGGDCMNFVSQTLAARGWAQRDDWYSNGDSSSESWRYVPTFDTWIGANASELGATRLTLDQRDQVKLGDLVVFDWDNTGTPDHIQIVSGIVQNADGTTSILMAGHNVDSDYRDLDETITVDHPGASVHFWSLTDG